MTETQHRQDHEGGDTFQCHPEANVWRVAPNHPEGHRLAGMLGNTARTCNFCGSMHPGDFMEGIRSGAYMIGTTTKNYKCYVDLAPTPEQIFEKRQALEQEVIRQFPDESFCDGHNSPEQMEEARENWIQHSLMIGAGKTIAKFYYEHLSPDQRNQFVELYNDHTVKIGYPGNFGVSDGMSAVPYPFFMVPA